MKNERHVLSTGLLGLALSFTLVQAQGPAASLAPANPTILVGQSQQFSASGLANPIAIGGGGYHTCMLLGDQSVRCAGLNNWGQLGNGGYANSPTLVAATGLTAPLSVGGAIEHTCALLADGTVRCWGTNYVGQIGDGTMDGTPAPKAVQGISTAIGVAVGGFHNCALLSDRTVRCWGRNQDGQVGNGDNTTDARTPQVVSGLSGVATVAAGGYHSCALMPDSTVRCWGRNTRGQLGAGNDTPFYSTPVAVTGMTTAIAVSGGFYHTCALLRDGTVQCWGDNDSGQIGSTLPYSNTPTTVAGVDGAVAISAGAFHSCALLSDGSAHCWGRNDSGQLGNGTTANSSSPVVVAGLSGGTSIGAGGIHSCAILADGSARCWGWNIYGQLADGTTTSALTSVRVSGTGLTWTSSNPTVATVNAAGRATGIARGTTTIMATDSADNRASTMLSVRTLETLSVTRAGAGSGTVTSTPAGIACGSDCSEAYLDGTSVTLTAAAAAGSVLTSWTGCDSVTGTDCTVAMNASRSVTANFSLVYPLTVTKAGLGGGTVTSNPAGINCGGTCSAPFVADTVVTLSVVPNLGSVFLGWNGCDTTTDTTCSVRMSAAKAVTANFLGIP